MLAASDELDVWFEDECHFQQHGSRCVMWVPPEVKDPVLLQAPTRKSVGVFGAVSVADGRLVTQRETTFNSTTFQQFLMQLLKHRRSDRKLLVVLDNSPYHHARALIPWLHEQRFVLSLDFLPPYSPKLNGIERVWKLTRRLCTHNRYFPVLDQLVDAVFERFSLWSGPNEILRRLCAIN